MTNPWKELDFSTYDSHIGHIDSFMILGIAGGNGLEHVDEEKIKRVVGVDINENYLKVCKEQFRNLKDILELFNIDISKNTVELPYCDLIIGNMILEFIGIDKFAQFIEKNHPKYVSVVFQDNQNQNFVSNSPYQKEFKGVLDMHQTITKDELDESLKEINMFLIKEDSYQLADKKIFLRIDYERKD